jgi:ribosome-associated protein
VRSQRHRSQAANKEEAIARFAELLAGALERRRPRTATKPTRAARERRLETKRRRASVKRGRSRDGDEG